MNWNLIKPYLFPFVFVIIVYFFVYINFKENLFTQSVEMNEYEEVVLAQPASSEDLSMKDETYYVDVKGSVEKPGIYQANSDDRVNDLIKKAGGFSASADVNQVNLAQRVFDEMVIYVPEEGDLEEPNYTDQVTGKTKIRINFASQEEVEQLQGIGPSKASAIIQYREENGPFQTIEDLLNVSGVGEKTLDNMREDIIIP